MVCFYASLQNKEAACLVTYVQLFAVSLFQTPSSKTLLFTLVKYVCVFFFKVNGRGCYATIFAQSPFLSLVVAFHVYI